MIAGFARNMGWTIDVSVSLFLRYGDTALYFNLSTCKLHDNILVHRGTGHMITLEEYFERKRQINT